MGDTLDHSHKIGSTPVFPGQEADEWPHPSGIQKESEENSTASRELHGGLDASESSAIHEGEEQEQEDTDEGETEIQTFGRMTAVWEGGETGGFPAKRVIGSSWQKEPGDFRRKVRGETPKEPALLHTAIQPGGQESDTDALGHNTMDLDTGRGQRREPFGGVGGAPQESENTF